MTVSEELFSAGTLTVSGTATFNADVFFAQLTQFDGNAVFNKEAQFNDTVRFSSNSGGYARIESGQETVHVTFTKPFTASPIVSLSLDSKFARYSYANVTTQGFDIVLDQPATEQLQFSWIALDVNAPVLSQ